MRKDNFSFDQTNFVQAKSITLNNITNGRPWLKEAAKAYWKYYDPTWGFTVDRKGYVVCEGEDPEKQVEWLRSRADSFVHHWVGVDRVEFITAAEYEKMKRETA